MMTMMTTRGTPRAPMTTPETRGDGRRRPRRSRARPPRASEDRDATETTESRARRLSQALDHARASASAEYSPGAGLGLTPEEQSEAAYADLLDTSLRAREEAEGGEGGLADEDAEAYASGGSMDKASMEVKNDGNAFKTAYGLFKALSRGAHIVNDDGRGRREG
jgi:hypothetical protein|tara:strand:+ start:317 stop:811 length:495 start_codon:yes stop_codon:yes gene_type:complete